MKTIGLIGGMSWLSSHVYYEHINKIVNERLGGIHSGQIQMHSVDYHPYYELQKKAEWDKLTDLTTDIANKLIGGGAECIVICCNTMHMVADKLQQRISVPFIHIADVTAKEIQKKNVKKVAFLGTTFTMNNNFFRGRIKEKFGIESITPNEADKEWLQNVIYDDFCRGVFTPEAKQKMLSMINELVVQGAEGVILGCTELPIVVQQSDLKIPVFDTTLIHSTAAVDFSLS